MTDTADGKRDFFVSFNQADRAWATWIAWVLEEAGYSVFLQDWDFQGNFVEHMNRSHAQAYRSHWLQGDRGAPPAARSGQTSRRSDLPTEAQDPAELYEIYREDRYEP